MLPDTDMTGRRQTKNSQKHQNQSSGSGSTGSSSRPHVQDVRRIKQGQKKGARQRVSQNLQDGLNPVFDENTHDNEENLGYDNNYNNDSEDDDNQDDRSVYSTSTEMSKRIRNDRSGCLISVSSSSSREQTRLSNLSDESIEVRAMRAIQYNLKLPPDTIMEQQVKNEVRKRIWSRVKFMNIETLRKCDVMDEDDIPSQILKGMNLLGYNWEERIKFWNTYAREVDRMISERKQNVSRIMKDNVLKGMINDLVFHEFIRFINLSFEFHCFFK